MDALALPRSGSPETIARADVCRLIRISQFYPLGLDIRNIFAGSGTTGEILGLFESYLYHLRKDEALPEAEYDKLLSLIRAGAFKRFLQLVAEFAPSRECSAPDDSTVSTSDA